MMCWVCGSHCVKASYHLLLQGSSSPRKILLLVLFDPEDDTKILQNAGNRSPNDIVPQCIERMWIHNRATMRNPNLAMKWNGMVYITFLQSPSHTIYPSLQFRNMNSIPSGCYRWTRQQCPITYTSCSSQSGNTSPQEAFQLNNAPAMA
jgi:hypothetical protein